MNISLKIIILTSLIFGGNNLFAQTAAEIGPNGLTLPRLTSTQRNALTPVKGNIIFNTTNNRLEYYDGATWLLYENTLTNGADLKIIRSNNNTSSVGFFAGLGTDFGLASTGNTANTIVGLGAGKALIGTPNTATGTYHNNYNLLFGTSAGASLRAAEYANDGMSASLNTVIGEFAGQLMGSKSVGNTLIGHEAGRFASASNYGGKLEGNVAIGGSTLSYAALGLGNVAIGNSTFRNAGSLQNNIALGNNVGASFASGNNNVLIGGDAVTNTSQGNNNTVIGSKAATTLNGQNNVIIGYMAADSLSGSYSNKLIISNSNTKKPLIDGEFEQKKLTVNGKLSVDAIAINNDPKPSAVVDLSNSSKGFLPPKMNNYQRNAIKSPEIGLTIFNTESNCLEFYVAEGWYNMCKNQIVAVSDIDGNSYSLVTIGNQVWLDQNLNVTKFNNGDVISELTVVSDWVGTSNPAWCWYGNTVKSNYIGKLYNWNVVNDSRNVCPVGFHVPTDAEWTTLTTFLGGENIAGGPLKQTGTSTWASPNTGATNSTKFTATSNGYRNFESTIYTDANYFSALGSYGTWWTKTNFDATRAYHRYMYWGEVAVNRSASNKKNGFAIRCIKD